MRNLILNEDLKMLLQGVAGVAVVGLLMGAVAHPNLREGDKAAGPQILLAGGGERGVQTISDPGVGAYGGRVPEYVIGTDATRPRDEPAWWTSEPEQQDEDTGPAVVFTGDDDPAQVQVTRAAWRDEPRPEPVYPSARGGATYEANLPGPPPPPPEGDDQALDLR